MHLVLVSGPTAEPISLAEAKLHLRVDDTADDALVTALLAAARDYAETVTGRALVAQTWDYVLDAFPSGDVPIRLPASPAVSIESITYVDAEGVTQTLSSALYTLDGREPARLQLAYGESWPTTRDEPNAVIVRFVAGHVAPFTADATANTLTPSGRSFALDARVRLSNSGGALPTGLSPLTDYFVVNPSGATIQLAATQGGAAIDLESAGTGTHYLGVVPAQVVAAMKLLVAAWYEQREGLVVGTISSDVAAPIAARRLLDHERVIRFA